MAQLHEIVEQRADIQKVRRELASLAKAEKVFYDRMNSAMTEFDRAKREHDNACRAALLQGKPPPEPPTWNPPGDPHTFRDERERLRARETAILAEHEQEIIEELHAREAALNRAVGRLVADIHDMLPEFRIIGDTLSAVRVAAHGDGNAVGHAGRVLDVHEIIDAALERRSVFASS